MLQHYAYALAYDFVLSWLTSVCMCICGRWIIHFCTLWAYWFYDTSHHMHLWIKSTLLMHSGCLRCFLMHWKLKKYIFFSIAPFLLAELIATITSLSLISSSSCCFLQLAPTAGLSQSLHLQTSGLRARPVVMFCWRVESMLHNSVVSWMLFYSRSKHLWPSLGKQTLIRA